MTRSPEMTAFVASLSRGGRAESFDVGALKRLAGAERDEARALLRERLRAGDGRAADALREAGMVEEVDALAGALSSLARVAAGRALWGLARDERGARAVAEALRDGRTDERRAAAAVAAEVRSEDVARALEAALEDPDALVRISAASAMLPGADLGNPFSLAAALARLLASPVAGARRVAVERLRDAAARLARGEDPRALGLTDSVTGAWASDLLARRRAAAEKRAPVDVVALIPLTGAARDWAELELLGQLPDPSAAAALAALGSPPPA